MTTTLSRLHRRLITECPTMMIYGMPSRPKSRNPDEVDERVNPDIPESARPATPQPAQPMVQVKAMPKQPPITLNPDPVGNPSFTFRRTFSLIPLLELPLLLELRWPIRCRFRLTWPDEQFRHKGPRLSLHHGSPIHRLPGALHGVGTDGSYAAFAPDAP